MTGLNQTYYSVTVKYLFNRTVVSDRIVLFALMVGDIPAIINLFYYVKKISPHMRTYFR